MQRIIPLIISLLFLSQCLHSQSEDKTYSFETNIYIPTYAMIKELYTFDKCNEEYNVELSKIYYSIRLFEQNGLDKLIVSAGSKVISDVEVEWNTLIISGAFRFKNRLVLLEIEPEKLKRLEFLFKKDDEKINGTINLDQYGMPTCFSTFLIDKQNLRLTYHSNNY